MSAVIVLLLSLGHAVVTLLLLNLFMLRVKLPADARRIRRQAVPWLAANALAGVGVAVWQWAVAGWAGGVSWGLAGLYVAWLLWKFGLRKQFPHERPLG